MEQDNAFECVCVYLLPRIQIYTHIKTHKTMLWPDPPISTPSFRKAPKPKVCLSFSITFLPTITTTPNLSKISQSLFPFSLISNVSMCYRHTPTHAHTHKVIPQSANHTMHIKALKLQFMTDDLLSRLQLIETNCANIWVLIKSSVWLLKVVKGKFMKARQETVICFNKVFFSSIIIP